MKEDRYGNPTKIGGEIPPHLKRLKQGVESLKKQGYKSPNVVPKSQTTKR